jgi:hypothetical protein
MSTAISSTQPLFSSLWATVYSEDMGIHFEHVVQTIGLLDTVHMNVFDALSWAVDFI